jgi:hypothetical protein
VQVTLLNVYSGVTVIVAVTATAVALVAVNEGIVLLVPLAAKPMLPVSLIQLYAVATPLKVIKAVDPL